jgi:EAL domain-containing protein (putative c-di-GMP-specific phosphodiesterase class I)
MALRASLAGTLVDGVGQPRASQLAITRRQLAEAIAAGQIPTRLWARDRVAERRDGGCRGAGALEQPGPRLCSARSFHRLAERWGLVDDLTGRVMHQAFDDAVPTGVG